MKLTAVGLFKSAGSSGEPIKLGFAADLTSFGYFQRSTVADMMTFEQDYYCHVYVNRDGLGGVAFVDKEYPARAAFCVVYKAIDDFIAAAGDAWKAASADDTTANTVLEACLAKYQDPAQVDKLTKIQRDLDDTKVVLHQTIESVLERGEKLDNLVAKSNDLGIASQLFYKQAKSTNSCCKMM